MDWGSTSFTNVYASINMMCVFVHDTGQNTGHDTFEPQGNDLLLD